MAKCEPDKCNAFCCKYISIHLDTPRSKVDFDEIRWFVSHENITVYKDDDDDWIVEVMTKCSFLKNNRCSIYEQRPDVCRDYDPDVCTHHSGEIPTRVLFTHPEQVEKFVEKRWPSKKKKSSGTRKKTGSKKPSTQSNTPASGKKRKHRRRLQ